MNGAAKKILILRLSSFGDIIQALGIIGPLKEAMPETKIDWVAREDFTELLQSTQQLNKVWGLRRAEGLKGLIRLGLLLRKEQYTHIYDAHLSLRSRILRLLLWRWNCQVIQRSKDRWKRILLFWFRINLFPRPYRGMLSYLAPLEKWQVRGKPQTIPLFKDVKLDHCLPDNFIALVPSAAWKMKRWPLDHFKKLIALNPEVHWVVLGGPGDSFCSELEAISPDRVINLAGKLTLPQSSFIVQQAALTLSADTGLLHIADLTGAKAIALIGPTAFGHPTMDHVRTLEVDLACRPCTKDGRGRCSQEVYQKCMVQITPEEVSKAITDCLGR